MNLWYIQVYMIFSAWCFHHLQGERCTAEECLSCGPSLPQFDIDCTVEEIASSQPVVLAYRLSCYVTDDKCPLTSEECMADPHLIGCYCALYIFGLKLTQDSNGSLTFISGFGSYHTQTYGFSECSSRVVVRELCETEENITGPLLNFLDNYSGIFSCRCFGTNCSRNITVTFSVEQQPDPNSISTIAVSQLSAVPVTSQMVLSSFPGSSSTSTIISSSSFLAGGFA